MKTPLTSIFAVVALVAVAVAYFQNNELLALRRVHSGDTALRKHYREAAEAAEAEIARLKSAADIAQENVARLTAERDAALARAKSLPPGGLPMPTPGASPPAGEKAGSGMMEGIAKMFSTEEGKKMMRSQMTMGLKM